MKSPNSKIQPRSVLKAAIFGGLIFGGLTLLIWFLMRCLGIENMITLSLFLLLGFPIDELNRHFGLDHTFLAKIMHFMGGFFFAAIINAIIGGFAFAIISAVRQFILKSKCEGKNSTAEI